MRRGDGLIQKVLETTALQAGNNIKRSKEEKVQRQSQSHNREGVIKTQSALIIIGDTR